MPERAYTVAEIDRMREAVRQRMPMRLAAVSISASGHIVYKNFTRERDTLYQAVPPNPAEVEDRLRTYMLAGVSPEELEAAYPIT